MLARCICISMDTTFDHTGYTAECHVASRCIPYLLSYSVNDEMLDAMPVSGFFADRDLP